MKLRLVISGHVQYCFDLYLSSTTLNSRGSGQVVNEFWLFGFDQRFFQSHQVLRWLTPDQLQQVLVGVVVHPEVGDSLILVNRQQVVMT